MALANVTLLIAKRMPTVSRQTDKSIPTLPAGCPKWITLELLDLTIQAWQKYSSTEITPDVALEILLNTSALLCTLETK